MQASEVQPRDSNKENRFGGSGRRGRGRGGYNNPNKRVFDRRSGTGRGTEARKENSSGVKQWDKIEEYEHPEEAQNAPVQEVEEEEEVKPVGKSLDDYLAEKEAKRQGTAFQEREIRQVDGNYEEGKRVERKNEEFSTGVEKQKKNKQKSHAHIPLNQFVKSLPDSASNEPRERPQSNNSRPRVEKIESEIATEESQEFSHRDDAQGNGRGGGRGRGRGRGGGRRGGGRDRGDGRGRGRGRGDGRGDGRGRGRGSTRGRGNVPNVEDTKAFPPLS